MTIALYHENHISGIQHHYDFIISACTFQIIANTEDKQYIEWYHPGWGSFRLPDITAKNIKDESK